MRRLPGRLAGRWLLSLGVFAGAAATGCFPVVPKDAGWPDTEPRDNLARPARAAPAAARRDPAWPDRGARGDGSAARPSQPPAYHDARSPTGYRPRGYGGYGGAPSECPGGVCASRVTRVDSLYFDHNDAELMLPSAPLEAFANLAMSSDQTVFVITGHADTTEVNAHSLCQMRAWAVRDYLVRRGVPSHRVLIHPSTGSMVLDGSPADAPRNRRVDLAVAEP